MTKEELYRLALTGTLDGQAIAKSQMVDIQFEAGLDEDVSEYATVAFLAAQGAAHNITAVGETYSRNQAGAGTSIRGGLSRVKEFGSVDSFKGLLTGEGFSDATPDQIANVSKDLNLKILKRDEFSETIFPTIVLPIGTVSFKAEVDVPMIKVKFSRTDGKLGGEEDICLYKTLTDTDGPLGKNDNKVNPVVDVSTDLNDFLVLDHKVETRDVFNNGVIETAPVAIGKPAPFLDLCQSQAALNADVMTDKTFLHPLVKIDSLAATVDGEFYSFGMQNVQFGVTPDGDGYDIGLSSSFVFTTVLTGKTMIDGDVGTAFDGADNVVFHYNVNVSGTGNTAEKELVTYVNRCDLFKITLAGNEVLSTDANYATYKAVGDKLTKDAMVGVNYDASITNEDMYRVGKRITIRNKSKAYAVLPTSPYTVVVAASTLSKGDSTIVDGLASAMIPEVNLDAPITLVNFASSLASIGVSGVLPLETKTGTIGDHLVRGYYKEEVLDLSKDMNSVSSGDRLEDIAGAVSINLRHLVSSMYSETALGEVRNILGKSKDVIIACGSDIAALLPSTIDLGPTVDQVKIVSTPASVFKNKIMVLPGNFASDRNRTPDYLSIGAYLYNPVLIGTINSDKARENTAHLFDVNAIFTPVIGVLNITGINKDGGLGKIVGMEQQV